MQEHVAFSKALEQPATPQEVPHCPTTRSHCPAARDVQQLGGLASKSSVMHEMFERLARLASTTVTLALFGETGTGKDVVARAVHRLSPRLRGAFVVFDCGAVPKGLIESSLLGHERGAYTGAVTSHPGAFEQAHEGTLFLDEIGELPLDLQPRLLRVLENRLVRRVGGSKKRAIDVRVIAATNRDLAAEVEAGRFRRDLYFRLCGATVRVPALRQRLEDLPLLVRQLLDDLGHPHLVVSKASYDRLRSYHWPGNVRELKNVLAFAAALADGGGPEGAAADTGALEPHHLRLCTPAGDTDRLDCVPLAGRPLEKLERLAIEQTLAQHGGNRLLAARTLGIAASTLYEKLRKTQIS